MLDFTSALYLGMRHPTRSLPAWTALTSGKPAILGESFGQQRVARSLSELVGCQHAVLSTSTLHLFWDLFGILADDAIAIYVDAGAYPIARWGVERAQARGVPVHSFSHHDPHALARLLRQTEEAHLRPVVLADGFCTGCGNPAPITDYLVEVQRRGGWLVLDDTQALGIFGRSPQPHRPYGWGGGGALQFANLASPNVLLACSLAKGFGVPIATLAGNRTLIRRFLKESETRMHCSPPSAAVVHAAERALAINRTYGDALRSHLATRVRLFKKRLAELGITAIGGMFPVQTLRLAPQLDAEQIHHRLLELQICGVLHRSQSHSGAALSFVITTRHRLADIERLVHALADIAAASVSIS